VVAAGILNKSAHGPRKAAATRAAENGATMHELSLAGSISRKPRFTPGRQTASDWPRRRCASSNSERTFYLPALLPPRAHHVKNQWVTGGLVRSEDVGQFLKSKALHQR
jgi:hypothetical protein